MDDKLINKSKERAKEWNKRWPKSAVFWSGGKDSTALLYFLKFECDINLPVVQFREPHFRERYEYSDNLIKLWNLEVYDYPPSKVSLASGPDVHTGEMRFDLLKYHQWGTKCMVLTLGTERPKNGEKYLCGIDFLGRPTGNFNWPWQAVYIGTKSCDEDLIKGDIPPAMDIRYADGSPISLYLMRDWSDGDIYEYLEENGVMPDPNRYEKTDLGFWSNKKDKSMNADYIPTCLNCIDRHSQESVVYCPKLKAMMSNMANKAPYEDINIPELGFDPIWK